MVYIFYFILILYFKHNGMSSTKILNKWSTQSLSSWVLRALPNLILIWLPYTVSGIFRIPTTFPYTVLSYDITSCFAFKKGFMAIQKVKVKWTHYRPGVAQRMGRGIALLFHDRGTRRGWVVISTPRPHFTHEKGLVPFYRRLGGPQGRSGRVENLVPTGIRSRTVQSVAQSLYRLTYPAHPYRRSNVILCYVLILVV